MNTFDMQINTPTVYEIVRYPLIYVSSVIVNSGLWNCSRPDVFLTQRYHAALYANLEHCNHYCFRIFGQKEVTFLNFY